MSILGRVVTGSDWRNVKWRELFEGTEFFRHKCSQNRACQYVPSSDGKAKWSERVGVNWLENMILIASIQSYL